VKVDWFSDPARIHREAQGIRALQSIAPPGSITPFVFEDHEHHLLAMQAVPMPHDNWKTLLLAGHLEDDHIEQFARLLACIHSRSAQRRDEFAVAFEDRSFFESLRLEPYYSYTATQVPQAADFIHRVIEDNRARRLAIVHGDYSPKNILVHQGKLVLLDHEVIHFGDPAFDLGFSMTHLLSKAHFLATHRERFAAAAGRYWGTYRATLGEAAWAADLEQAAVRNTLGCLLARVAGRSPLEYMGDEHRGRQRRAVLRLMSSPPATVGEMISGFLSGL
jgi:aminoglycoside phosphotransferase (APT) family kinase protein